MTEFRTELFLVHYKLKLTAKDYEGTEEAAALLAKGYELVTKREHWDRTDEFYELAQARHAKTIKQRLRRMQGGK